uniref:EF-hand domain-containing protein n=1 Tax=Timema monikensis TaxID=170555 RepID=A0A7R9HSU3_9NEOP|nr:unnamed protein product [Timema monikensis]
MTRSRSESRSFTALVQESFNLNDSLTSEDSLGTLTFTLYRLHLFCLQHEVSMSAAPSVPVQDLVELSDQEEQDPAQDQVQAGDIVINYKPTETLEADVLTKALASPRHSQLDLSYFTKKEVLYAHQKFKALAPEKIGHNKNAKLPLPKVLTYPELKVNPFGDRICRIFSSSHDGDCTFEDFLDMMSVFSDAAPKAVKAEHAFRIFDFDGDDMLGVTDLRQVVDRLTGPQRLAEQDIQHLIQNILDEADLDDDGALSFAEFEHIISKSSDFANAFRIRL